MVIHTYEDKYNMIIIYGKCHENAAKATHTYRTRFPGRPTPTPKTFVSLSKNLLNYGSFKKPKRTRRKNVRTDENTALVLQTVNNNPRTSLRQLEIGCNISKTSCQRILKQNKYFPYKVRLVHHLKPGDQQRRMDFLSQFTVMLEEEDNLLNRIMWSDESRFHNNGVVSKQNCRYWSEENPRWFRQTRNQTIFGVNVWCGIVNGYIIGPHLYHGTLNGQRYLDFLENDLPHLLNNVPIELPNIWLQQDGAPPHNAEIVRNYLNRTFGERWIGTNAVVRWPARSPDLTPLDFFLWGYLKSTVYEEPIEDMADLYNKIYASVAAINRETLLKVCRTELLKRYNMCVQNDGNNFEHLI